VFSTRGLLLSPKSENKKMKISDAKWPKIIKKLFPGISS
jgi:hypothetical protein